MSRRTVFVSTLFAAVFCMPPPSHAQARPQADRPSDAREVNFIFVSTPRPEDRALAEQVMQVDEDFRRAKLAADRAALDRLVSDDYVGLNQTGNMRDKKQLLELFEWFRIASLVTNRASVRFSGDNAIVTGEQRKSAGPATTACCSPGST